MAIARATASATEVRAERAAVRVHLTNSFGLGLGAVQLASSLLPALERSARARVEQIYVPARGPLASYERRSPGPPPERYRRALPNAVSRLLECTVLGGAFDGRVPLLVLGDLPIRCRTRQTVLVQTRLVTEARGAWPGLRGMKYRVARAVFRMNAPYASAFVVQTEPMKAALEATYPAVRGKVSVVPQPVPTWLAGARGTRTGRKAGDVSRLRLFYPAQAYPYKNHALLAELGPDAAARWPVSRLTFTIPRGANPNPRVPWIDCVGLQEPAGVLRLYAEADALVFLSKEESYGFPLLEAMWVGLPIVCPDLPYARAICGDDAIYFDVGSAESLEAAVRELATRLARGWWPSWDARLAAFPSSWDDVADEMLRIALGGA